MHTDPRGRRQNPSSPPMLPERLERRVMLDAVPAGPEFAVNTTTEGNQRAPSVAVDADGDYVVAWAAYDGDAGRAGSVFARRFNRDGAALGPEFRVSEPALVPGSYAPRVAAEDDGGFVVFWRALNADRETVSILARRYDASGAPAGGPAVVDSDVRAAKYSVAIDAAGGFAVAFGSDDGVFARRFDASGAPVGGRLLVAPFEPYVSLRTPSVASDDAGNFVVAWERVPTENRDITVRFRRFGADGAARGGTEIVNPFFATGVPYVQAPQVAADDDGDFAVAWSSDGPAGVGTYARLYNPAGQPKGPAFRALATPVTPGGIAMDADGDFVIVAECPDGEPVPVDLNLTGVCARRFDRDGTPQGPDFHVNTYVPGHQLRPAVASADTGDFVVAWQSAAQDGSGDGVYAQRYRVDAPAPPAAVVGRHAFYFSSAYDGERFTPHTAAIAADKVALLPGQRATFANVTSYDKGINGIIVDVAGLPRAVGATVTRDDFDFGTADAPLEAVRWRGAGAGGSDRIILYWADYATANRPDNMALGNGWLTVTVKANEHTALATPDVFSFGNLIGDTGDGGGASGWRVSSLDMAAARRAQSNVPQPVTSLFDFNRDGRVSALDLTVVKRNLNRTLAIPPVPSSATPPRLRREADEIL